MGFKTLFSSSNIDIETHNRDSAMLHCKYNIKFESVAHVSNLIVKLAGQFINITSFTNKIVSFHVCIENQKLK